MLTGNLEAGRAYFSGAGKCNTCHSPSGDLAGIGRKYDPIELQQRFLFPRRSKPLQVTVTPAGGQPVTGLARAHRRFQRVLARRVGPVSGISRDKNVRVDLDDPLAAHHQMLDVYTDQDMHNVVRYLESLQ